MCVAVPGKVIEIDTDNNMAKIDFNGNTVKARTGLVELELGDYALVHAGCVIQKMECTEALELIEMFYEIEGIV